MKAWKKLLMAVAISVAIAVAIWPLSQHVWWELHVKPVLSEYPPELWPWLDVGFYSMTWYSRVPLVVDAIIALLWVGIAMRKLFRSRTAVVGVRRRALEMIGILLAMVILTAFIPSLNIPAKAQWNSWEVDVLAMGDEEFMAHPEWKTNVQNTLATVNDYYVNFGITFRIRGWKSWDSADYEDNIYWIWQEGIHECGLPIQWIELAPDNIPGLYGWGFVSGSEWQDGNNKTWWIDLLLMFSGQNFEVQGLSVPRTNATLIRFDSIDYYVIAHELGHQYYVLHCSNHCLMNTGWLSASFCSSCAAQLTAHRNKWMTDPLVYFVLSNEGEGVEEVGAEFVSPPVWGKLWGYKWGVWLGGARYKYNTSITVRVQAKPGYIFNGFHVVNAPWTYTQNPDDPPPPSFWIYNTLQFQFLANDTWTILAFFRPISASATVGSLVVTVSLNNTGLRNEGPFIVQINLNDSAEQPIGLCVADGLSCLWFELTLQIPAWASPGIAIAHIRILNWDGTEIHGEKTLTIVT